MSKIIVALDNMSLQKAQYFAGNLAGKVWGFKVNDLLVEHGVDIIKSLKRYGNIFADPKFYDIPTTVGHSVKRLVNAGADMVTVHVSGGLKMLMAAMEAAHGSPTKIIGVTMLTSMEFEEIRETYRGWPLERFADIVGKAQLDGIVCAGSEMPFWKLFDLLKVVPGIRPFGAVDNDDQIRTCQVVGKADFLVIGRPITQSNDPVGVVETIREMYS